MQELLVGNEVQCSTGETGCITGFFVARPETKRFINGAPVSSEHGEWFRQTSYAVARAEAGFARISAANGPVYWCLDQLTVVDNDEMITLDEDDW